MKKLMVFILAIVILLSLVFQFTSSAFAEDASSDDFKLKLIDEYGALTVSNGYLTGVSDFQTSENVISQFLDSDTVSISQNGKKLSDVDYVGTGCLIYNEKNYHILDSVTAVISGDVNGDGKVTTVDYIKIKKCFSEILQLEGAYFMAADIDGNKSISTNDYIKIKKYFYGKYNLYTYTSYLWEKDTNGYISYRIPGIVTTNNGTLLSYCEARQTTDDWANIDILMRRSTDGGKTWSKSVKLSKGMPSGTKNNPVMIVDSNNKIHMMISYNYGIPWENGKLYYLTSDDDGLTWSKPVDITYMTFDNGFSHAHFACGPSHGIQLKDGTLIFPFWFVYASDFTDKQNASPSYISVMYSKDNGNTWQLGEVLETESSIQYASEPSIVQLNDVSVMLNVRIYSEKASVRGIATSPDGIFEWSKIKLEEQLPDPFCQGSIFRYDANTLLFANCNSEYSEKYKDRLNLTIRYSKDDGTTWSQGTVVCATDSMYSDITVRNGIIYVIYEEGFYDGLSVNIKRYRITDIQ